MTTCYPKVPDAPSPALQLQPMHLIQCWFGENGTNKGITGGSRPTTLCPPQSTWRKMPPTCPGIRDVPSPDQHSSHSTCIQTNLGLWSIYKTKQGIEEGCNPLAPTSWPVKANHPLPTAEQVRRIDHRLPRDMGLSQLSRALQLQHVRSKPISGRDIRHQVRNLMGFDNQG